MSDETHLTLLTQTCNRCDWRRVIPGTIEIGVWFWPDARYDGEDAVETGRCPTPDCGGDVLSVWQNR